jgi:dipeptidyl aminopeptidase/acylaminoacyl peptidase
VEGDVVREAGVAVALVVAACRAPAAPVSSDGLARWDIGSVHVSGAPALDEKIVETLVPYARVAGWRLMDFLDDGTRMLVQSRGRLFELDAPGATPRPIAADGSVRWAAYQGGTIVVATDRDGDERWTLWRDGARIAEGVVDPIAAHGHLAWAEHSPDGAKTIVRLDDVAVFAGDGIWAPLDVSQDGGQLLVRHTIAARTSAIYRYDIATTRTTAITPTDLRAAAIDAKFDRDGQVFAVADLGGDRLRLIVVGDHRTYPIDVAGEVDRLAVSRTRDVFSITTTFADKKTRLLSGHYASPEALSVELTRAGVIEDVHDNSTNVAFTFTDPSHPRGVYALSQDAPWVSSSAATLAPVTPELTTTWSFDRTAIKLEVFTPVRAARSPVVIDLHGGPEDRVRPRWQPFVQFLVARGFAVVQPDVRGSTGYGAAFAALDDGPLREDAVRDVGAVLDWIATRPDLDRDRVFVMGTSYGGFLALSALARFPERLRGGIVLSGIADIPTFLATTRADRRDNRRAEYGDERDPDTRAFLARISPLANVDRIRAPVLLAHGRRDPRVPIAVTDRFVAALRAAGKTAWYVVADDEGHGFDKAESRGVYEVLATQFLERYAATPASRSR